MAITTVTACKSFRNIAGDNPEHDEELARIIPAVQQFLERKCERSFDQATVTEYYHGAGASWNEWSVSAGIRLQPTAAQGWRDRLLVARPPLVSVTNLWDDPLRVYATPIDPALYVIADPNVGLIQLDRIRFQPGLNNIKVTYVGGFAVMPTDLEQAAIEMVWAAREKGVNNLIGVRSRAVAGDSVQYVNLDWGGIALDPIINQYRLHIGVA